MKRNEIALYLITLWAMIILCLFLIPHSDPDVAKYLLSTISQSLAALFALIFSILLVGTQIYSKYSIKTIERFFDKYTMTYVLFFLISIFFPWIVLKELETLSNNLYFVPDRWINVSIFIGGTSIFMLIPFIYHFKNRMNIETYLTELQRKALTRVSNVPKEKKLSLEELEKYTSEIDTIENIIMASYSQYDYDTFGRGTEEILNIMIEVKNSNITDEIIGRVLDVFDRTSEDPKMPIRIVEGFSKITNRAVENDKVNYNYLMVLEHIYLYLINNNHWGEWKIRDVLKNTGFEFIRKKDDDFIAWKLYGIYEFSTKKHLEKGFYEMLYRDLKEIGDCAINNKRPNFVHETLNSMRWICERFIEVGKVYSINELIRYIGEIGEKTNQRAEFFILHQHGREKKSISLASLCLDYLQELRTLINKSKVKASDKKLLREEIQKRINSLKK